MVDVQSNEQQQVQQEQQVQKEQHNSSAEESESQAAYQSSETEQKVVLSSEAEKQTDDQSLFLKQASEAEQQEQSPTEEVQSSEAEQHVQQEKSSEENDNSSSLYQSAGQYAQEEQQEQSLTDDQSSSSLDNSSEAEQQEQQEESLTDDQSSSSGNSSEAEQQEQQEQSLTDGQSFSLDNSSEAEQQEQQEESLTDDQSSSSGNSSEAEQQEQSLTDGHSSSSDNSSEAEQQEKQEQLSAEDEQQVQIDDQSVEQHQAQQHQPTQKHQANRQQPAQHHNKGQQQPNIKKPKRKNNQKLPILAEIEYNNCTIGLNHNDLDSILKMKTNQSAQEKDLPILKLIKYNGITIELNKDEIEIAAKTKISILSKRGISKRSKLDDFVVNNNNSKNFKKSVKQLPSDVPEKKREEEVVFTKARHIEKINTNIGSGLEPMETEPIESEPMETETIESDTRNSSLSYEKYVYDIVKPIDCEQNERQPNELQPNEREPSDCEIIEIIQTTKRKRGRPKKNSTEIKPTKQTKRKKIIGNSNILSNEAVTLKSIEEIHNERQNWILKKKELGWAMLSDSERKKCNSNKKTTKALNRIFFPLVHQCHSAYKSATKHVTLSTMEFETKFQHCWTVSNMAKYKTFEFKVLYNTVNEKFGFLTKKKTEFTADDIETLNDMEIHPDDIEYEIDQIVGCEVRNGIRVYKYTVLGFDGIFESESHKLTADELKEPFRKKHPTYNKKKQLTVAVPAKYVRGQVTTNYAKDEVFKEGDELDSSYFK